MDFVAIFQKKERCPGSKTLYTCALVRVRVRVHVSVCVSVLVCVCVCVCVQIRLLLHVSGVSPSNIRGLGLDFTSCTMLPTT